MIAWCVLLPVITLTSCEYYSSVSELVVLLETESKLLGILEKYVATVQEKLDFLRKKVLIFDKQQKDARHDGYLLNPINAFSLIMRVSKDWNNVVQVLNQIEIEVQAMKVEAMRDDLPTLRDIEGAGQGLITLQVTYNLDARDLQRGLIKGKQYSTNLTEDDCYELGMISYSMGKYEHSANWLELALRSQDSRLDRFKIMEHLAFAEYKRGNINKAVKIAQDLLEIKPDDLDVQKNLQLYESTPDISRDESQENRLYSNHDIYKLACRGEVSPSDEIQSRLKCRYVHNNIPFLQIAPFKLEEIYPDPKIYVFREVLNDLEIQRVKDLAMKEKLRSATVDDIQNGRRLSGNRRCEVAWLEDYDDEVVARITSRVGDMTSLSMETSEPLQVGYYGIGGHYYIHNDFHEWDGSVYGEINRIATVIFYLSDVEEGGATVFTDVGVVLPPEKGSAAFWYNLHPSGEGDFRTTHAGCPVLIGSKWIANKWILNAGQEFRRRCTLVHEVSNDKEMEEVDIKFLNH